MIAVLPPAVTVHEAAHVRLALSAARSAGRPILLLSAPAAVAAVGVGFFQALARLGREDYPDVSFIALLDCGVAPGRATGALRAGLDGVIFSGDHRTYLKLADQAEDLGVSLLDARPPSLDLLGMSEAAATVSVLKLLNAD